MTMRVSLVPYTLTTIRNHWSGTKPVGHVGLWSWKSPSDRISRPRCPQPRCRGCLSCRRAGQPARERRPRSAASRRRDLDAPRVEEFDGYSGSSGRPCQAVTYADPSVPSEWVRGTPPLHLVEPASVSRPVRRPRAQRMMAAKPGHPTFECRVEPPLHGSSRSRGTSIASGRRRSAPASLACRSDHWSSPRAWGRRADTPRVRQLAAQRSLNQRFLTAATATSNSSWDEDPPARRAIISRSLATVSRQTLSFSSPRHRPLSYMPHT